ncbi:unnamed protein product [Amoebophrya sp. A120]|nr:unnamed protein product [Amoebophrya sp. A120]|eukprot:GSA120T00005761001.1
MREPGTRSSSTSAATAQSPLAIVRDAKAFAATGNSSTSAHVNPVALGNNTVALGATKRHYAVPRFQAHRNNLNRSKLRPISGENVKRRTASVGSAGNHPSPAKTEPCKSPAGRFYQLRKKQGHDLSGQNSSSAHLENHHAGTGPGSGSSSCTTATSGASKHQQRVFPSKRPSFFSNATTAQVPTTSLLPPGAGDTSKFGASGGPSAPSTSRIAPVALPPAKNLYAHDFGGPHSTAPTANLRGHASASGSSSSLGGLREQGNKQLGRSSADSLTATQFHADLDEGDDFSIPHFHSGATPEPVRSESATQMRTYLGTRFHDRTQFHYATEFHRASQDFHREKRGTRTGEDEAEGQEELRHHSHSGSPYKMNRNKLHHPEQAGQNHERHSSSGRGQLHHGPQSRHVLQSRSPLPPSWRTEKEDENSFASGSMTESVQLLATSQLVAAAQRVDILPPARAERGVGVHEDHTRRQAGAELGTTTGTSASRMKMNLVHNNSHDPFFEELQHSLTFGRSPEPKNETELRTTSTFLLGSREFPEGTLTDGFNSGAGHSTTDHNAFSNTATSTSMLTQRDNSSFHLHHPEVISTAGESGETKNKPFDKGRSPEILNPFHQSQSAAPHPGYVTASTLCSSFHHTTTATSFGVRSAAATGVDFSVTQREDASRASPAGSSCSSSSTHYAAFGATGGLQHSHTTGASFFKSPELEDESHFRAPESLSAAEGKARAVDAVELSASEGTPGAGQVTQQRIVNPHQYDTSRLVERHDDSSMTFGPKNGTKPSKRNYHRTRAVKHGSSVAMKNSGGKNGADQDDGFSSVFAPLEVIPDDVVCPDRSPEPCTVAVDEQEKQEKSSALVDHNSAPDHEGANDEPIHQSQRKRVRSTQTFLTYTTSPIDEEKQSGIRPLEGPGDVDSELVHHTNDDDRQDAPLGTSRQRMHAQDQGGEAGKSAHLPGQTVPDLESNKSSSFHEEDNINPLDSSWGKSNASSDVENASSTGRPARSNCGPDNVPDKVDSDPVLIGSNVASGTSSTSSSSSSSSKLSNQNSASFSAIPASAHVNGHLQGRNRDCATSEPVTDDGKSLQLLSAGPTTQAQGVGTSTKNMEAVQWNGKENFEDVVTTLTTSSRPPSLPVALSICTAEEDLVRARDFEKPAELDHSPTSRPRLISPSKQHFEKKLLKMNHDLSASSSPESSSPAPSDADHTTAGLLLRGTLSSRGAVELYPSDMLARIDDINLAPQPCGIFRDIVVAPDDHTRQGGNASDEMNKINRTRRDEVDTKQKTGATCQEVDSSSAASSSCSSPSSSAASSSASSASSSSASATTEAGGAPGLNVASVLPTSSRSASAAHSSRGGSSSSASTSSSSSVTEQERTGLKAVEEEHQAGSDALFPPAAAFQQWPASRDESTHEIKLHPRRPPLLGEFADEAGSRHNPTFHGEGRTTRSARDVEDHSQAVGEDDDPTRQISEAIEVDVSHAFGAFPPSSAGALGATKNPLEERSGDESHGRNAGSGRAERGEEHSASDGRPDRWLDDGEKSVTPCEQTPAPQPTLQPAFSGTATASSGFRLTATSNLGGTMRSTGGLRRRNKLISGSLYRWIKGDPVGCGSLGTVFKALDTETGKLLAVKEVSLHDATDLVKKNLDGELNSYRSLRHDAIIQYLGHETMTLDGQDVLFIYLEFMPGGSLSAVIHTFGPLDESLVRVYCRQLLRGLAYLHERNFIHRDIKGANILVGLNCCVKLSDFGCAKQIMSRSGDQMCAQTMTGSIPWMSPDVMKGTPYDTKADIWSLGCLLIEMASGRAPWSELCFDNNIAMLMRIAMTDDVPEIPAHLSATARNFVARCLTRDPQKRPTAKELLLHDFVQKTDEVVADAGGEENT